MLRVRVTIDGFVGGPGLNTYYFMDDVEDGAMASTCCARVRDALIAGAGLYPPAVTHQVQPEVDKVNPVDGKATETFVAETFGPVAGTYSNGNQAPAAVAALIKMQTAAIVDGKRVKGRSFLSPIALGHLDVDGRLAAAGLTAAGLTAVGLLDLIEQGPFLAVWSRPRAAGSGKFGNLTARPGQAVHAVSVTVPAKLAVLRSRRD